MISIDGQEREIMGGIKVVAKEWKKAGKNRIYFTVSGQGTSGQACWDCNENVFIKCRNQVGSLMMSAIAEAFSL